MSKKNKNHLTYMNLVIVKNITLKYYGYTGRVRGIKNNQITVKLFLDNSVHIFDVEDLKKSKYEFIETDGGD
jgi:hypothetical protein